jgi:hypothetical protein
VTALEKATTMNKVTFIMSPSRNDLYEALRKTMSGEANVEVVMDRRVWPMVPITPRIDRERRQVDRVAQEQINKEIHDFGWTVVKTPLP